MLAGRGEDPRVRAAPQAGDSGGQAGMSAVVGQTRGQGRETFLSAEHGGLTLQCEMGPRVSSRCIGIACAPGISGFWSRLCCYITVWPWRSHLRSVAFSKSKGGCWGARGAQSVEHRTLGFSSGHDLTVCEFESCVGLCADGADPAWDSLSLSLCPTPARTLSLSK